MKTTVLGTGTDAPLTVGRLGLGLMGISAFYSGAGQDDAGGARTILGALDRGVTLLDTASQAGLREKASRRSSGLSAAIRSSHSAEKNSAVSASPTGTTAWVIVSS